MENMVPLYTPYHVDDAYFKDLCATKKIYVQSISSWAGDSESKWNTVKDSVLSVWKSKRTYYTEFECLSFELALSYSHDIRSFIQKTPFLPCWLASRILIVLNSVLKELAVINGRSMRHQQRLELDLLQIPEQICEAVASIYSGGAAERIINDYEKLCSYELGAPGNHRENCSICALINDIGS